MKKNKQNKQKMVSVTILLPKVWLRLIDQDAVRQVTNRSQIIRSRLQDSCLRFPSIATRFHGAYCGD